MILDSCKHKTAVSRWSVIHVHKCMFMFWLVEQGQDVTELVLALYYSTCAYGKYYSTFTNAV